MNAVQLQCRCSSGLILVLVQYCNWILLELSCDCRGYLSCIEHREQILKQESQPQASVSVPRRYFILLPLQPHNNNPTREICFLRADHSGSRIGIPSYPSFPSSAPPSSFSPFLAAMFSVRKASASLPLRRRPPATAQFLSSLHTTARMRMASTLPRLPLFETLAGHDPKSTAIVHSASGKRFTYGQLLGDVARAKDRLLQEAGGGALDGLRVAFLVENSYDYVGT
jgi:hypothetical protein